ncbi:RxLR effector protein [Phytophthora megakarya]|uniref:RxLR effector protein n=1 Tax=Phytophthora megakarya TaxID=4795 RepID=A0A225UZA0_9STRA|nr:RxLR effector protein [Phytophthora megakarya]
MRLMYTIALVAAVTLCPSSAALPTEDFNEMTKNAGSSDMLDLRTTEGGRLLRRVDYDSLDDGRMEEERGFDLKKVASKLNPAKAAKKTAAKVAKVKEVLKEATEYQKMMDAANRIVKNE